jgi:hypothetical protein
MALNRKGSRPITVDGTEYRWRIRRRPTCSQDCCGQSPLTYAVEAVGTPRAGGTVLHVTTGHLRPGTAFCPEPWAPVLPSRVAATIRAALAEGWRPAEPGAAFRLTRPDG